MFHLVAAVAEEAAYHNNIAALFQSLAELLSAAVLLLSLLATMLAVLSLVVVLLLVRASERFLSELLLEDGFGCRVKNQTLMTT